AVVAAAHVHGHGQAVRAAGQRLVDHGQVDLVLVLRVEAGPGGLLAPGGVVEEGEQGVVELEVAAAEGGHRGDLAGVRPGQVGVELVPVGVAAGGDVGPEVRHAGRGDGELGHRGGHRRGEEAEVASED